MKIPYYVPIELKIRNKTTLVLASLLLLPWMVHGKIISKEPIPDINAGELLTVVLQETSAAAEQIKLTILKPRIGMSITQISPEKHVFSWDTKGFAEGEYKIGFQASRIGDTSVTEIHTIVVNLLERQVTENLPHSTLSVTTHPPQNQTPVFEQIPTQINSAGQIVKIEAIATIENDEQADLVVDWLPLGASFEVNQNGIHTLSWNTKLSDSGQHKFRFTATHP